MAELRDLFAPVSFVLEETKDVVDGQSVLGKLKGCFFVPDGVSRNKRFYGKDVWERQLKNEEVQSKLKDRRMFGTIGHKIKVDDESLAEGKLSHVTTGLQLNGEEGQGEALILNTPTGRILNTVLRAGSKLYVSSRASGDYKGTSHGVPNVDPDTYHLEGFDFVLEPGFLQANPAIVESLQKDLKEYLELVETKPDPKQGEPSRITEEIPKASKLEDKNNDELGGIQMSKELIEQLAKEKVVLQEDLTKSLKQLEEVKQDHVVLGSEVTSLREQLKKAEEKAAKIETYEKLGSPEDIEKALDLSEKVLWKYKESGSPDEVRTALDKAYDELKKYRGLGTTSEISEAFDKAEILIKKYRELGTVAELHEALDTATKVFQKFQELGSPAEISLALDKAGKLAEGIKVGKFNDRIKKLADELGVSTDSISEVAKKMSDVEVRKFVKSLVESNKLKNKYLVKDPKKDTKVDSKSKETDKSSPFNKTRGESLMEQFSR
jgi:Prohead core protein serine protease